MEQPLEILFKEYDTLRTEIISLTGHAYNVMGFAAALSAAMLTWAASHRFDRRFWILLIVFAALIWLLWMLLHVATSRIAERLREIEGEVNSMAGANLLQWETHKSPSRHWLITRVYRWWNSK